MTEAVKKYKTQILVLSLISVAGLTYFLYSKVKMYSLNKKVQSLDEIQNQINNLPPDDGTIEEVPVDPNMLPTPDFGGGNVDTTSSGATIPLTSSTTTTPDYGGEYTGYIY